MKLRSVIFTFLLISAICASAIDDFTLKGTVRDRTTGGYVPYAKVECIDYRDSIVGDADALDYDFDYNRQVAIEKSDFTLVIPRVKGRYTLRFSHEEYDTISVPLNLTDIGAREYDRDLGVYYISRPKVTKLKEVEVTASKILFYNRGDTIVYNADAFELADGSMLDALIEQLPGVELREGGKIYVNGKFVESLLLNGKDFFKGNNQLMLDNLAAYTVKNIEVYKKQTERAKFLGLDDESNKTLVMDVKLKKEYIGGWSINTELAGGTEDRYLSRLFAMNYRALSQFTLIGNINNLNDDSRPTAEDQWDPDNMTDGDRRYIETGIDYSMENEDASRKASGNLVYTNSRNFNRQTTQTTIFLPGQNTYGLSTYEALSQDYDISTRYELYYQSSRMAINFKPIVGFSRGHNDNFIDSSTSRDESGDQLINKSLSDAFSKNKRLYLMGELSTTLKIPKTSDALDIFGEVSYRGYEYLDESCNIIRYGDPSIPADARHQMTDNNPTNNVQYSLGTRYNFVLNSKFNASFTYKFETERANETSSFYLGRLAADNTGDYTLESLYKLKMDFDPENSNISESRNREHSIGAQATWSPTKELEFSTVLPLAWTHHALNYRQNGIEYPASVDCTHLDARFMVSYTKYKGDAGYKSVMIDFSRNAQLPMPQNMITIPNTRDPLSVYLGNPDLKPAVSNSVYVMAQTANRHNFNAYIYGYYQSTSDAITQTYRYDTNTGQRTYKTINVDGNWMVNSNLYLNWYWEKYNWSFSLVGSYSHQCTHNILSTASADDQRVTLHSNTFNPSLRIIKYFSKRKNYIALLVRPTFTKNISTDISAANLNPTNGYFQLSGKYSLSYGWSLSSSVTLRTRDGYNDPEMDRDEWIWNGRISKSLLKGRLLASFVAYDLLHQHNAYNYRVTPQMRIETFTNTIPRYVLIDLQYKINIEPKKKIAQTTIHY